MGWGSVFLTIGHDKLPSSLQTFNLDFFWNIPMAIVLSLKWGNHMRLILTKNL